MEKIPRHVDIDYSKYAPDIPEDQLEAYYGLPKHVQFCKECVMSNQKPNSCYEFEHTIKSIKKTMVIQDDGTCDACQCANAHTHSSASPLQSAGGGWPSRVSARRSSAAAASGRMAGASVCLLSFSPAAFTSTGKCI